MSKDLCRVCLTGNVKIYFIRHSPLQLIFEKLTSYKLCTEDGRPETVCYICYSQLQKYLRLNKKSQKSEEKLMQLLNNGIQILRETVSVLNRGIQHDFCVTSIEVYNSPKHETQVAVKEEPDVVKQESMTVNNNQPGGDETVVPVVEADTAPCRMCLSSDVTTCSIKSTPLQTVYEKLTNNKFQLVPGGEAVCYICRWQLIKCRRFITKSNRSEKILTELFRNGIQLTRDTVFALNSRNKTSFIVSPVESTSYHTTVLRECSVILNKLAMKQLIQFQLEKQDTKHHPTRKQKEQLSCNSCAFTCYSSGLMQQHVSLHDPKRQFACNLCPKRYTRMCHLQQHRRTHNYNYKCPKCDEKFTRKRKLNMHVLINHAKNTSACDKCDKVYKNRHDQREHKLKMHPADKYPCGRCGATFASEKWRDDHVFLTHGRKFPYYICDVCGRELSSRSTMRKHITLVHVQKTEYKCEQCDRIFKWKATYEAHLLSHSGAKPYQCDVCGRAFRYKPGLYTHRKQHGEKLFVCKICDKPFTTEYTLKLHVITHAKIKYKCEICNKQFSLKRFLDEHAQAHESGFKTYTCEECGKSFPLNGQLKIHMYKHKPKPRKPFEICKICNEPKSCMTLHMRSHTGEKPYTCHICNKTFAGRGNYRQHMMQHEGLRLRPHACTVCGKRFYRTAHLQVHMATHAQGAKPFECEVCGSAFYLARQLAQHARTHRPKQTYACDRCERTFNEKRALECHIVNTHRKTKFFVCDYCFKVYTVKKDFVAHVRAHATKQKFACILCNQWFTKIGILAQHVKKHIADKKTVCPLCKRKFIRCNLPRHYQMVHGGATPYACTVCEEGFGTLDGVYAHYIRNHKGKTPYSCNLCDTSFTRGGGLRRHIKRAHMIVQARYTK